NALGVHLMTCHADTTLSQIQPRVRVSVETTDHQADDGQPTVIHRSTPPSHELETEMRSSSAFPRDLDNLLRVLSTIFPFGRFRKLMLQHPQIDPVALQLGPVAIHWYGLMYLLGFAAVWLLGRRRIRQGLTDFSTRELEDIIFYSVIGVIAGGRFGYALIYKPAYYLTHPLEIRYVWEGGMSFHGGLLGVVLVLVWYARRRGRHVLEVGDFIAPMIPLGLAA